MSYLLDVSVYLPQAGELKEFFTQVKARVSDPAYTIPSLSELCTPTDMAHGMTFAMPALRG